MTDMNIEFIGGNLDGQTRAPINEEELSSLGYRVQLKGQPKGDELAPCIAVPAEWTPEEGHKAVKEKLSPRNRRH
jgi:hypothetical protein